MRQSRGQKTKGKGQVQSEKLSAPVITASYKANHSDELLAFLLKKCNTSRNNVKNLLTNRQVLVNGALVTQYNFPLAKDDEVKIAKYSVQGAVETKAAATRPPRKSELPDIIYEDEDFIAVNKPVGLLSVESDTETRSAFSQVFAYLKYKDKTARPYVLHRIDKETSGVLVFAKNIKLHSMLKMHWNEQVTLREYYAVAEGAFEEKQAEIVTYLKANKNNLMYSTKDPSGQKAITRYQVQKETERYSLLRVEIDTGRKNQIRVHLHDLEHPIVGDDKYGHTQNPLKRLGLHASRLQFIHPLTKELLTFSAPVPAEFYSLFR